MMIREREGISPALFYFKDVIYSSHSEGRNFLFFVLQFLQQAAILNFSVFPPLESGII